MPISTGCEHRAAIPTAATASGRRFVLYSCRLVWSDGTLPDRPTASSPWEFIFIDSAPPQVSRALQEPPQMPSALLLNYNSGNSSHAIGTTTGRGGHAAMRHIVIGRDFLCTSAPLSRRLRSLLAKAGYTTTASSCSFISCLRPPRTPRSARWDSI